MYLLGGTMPIIGATYLIKYKKFQAKPSKARGAYKQRNDRLSTLGYAGYQEYLKSDDWKAIKEVVFQKHKDCCVCGGVASQLHHWDYHDLTMLGLNNEFLLPICDGCHEGIEFDGSRKRSLKEVQKLLFVKLRPYYRKRLVSGQARRKVILRNAKPVNWSKNPKHRKKKR